MSDLKRNVDWVTARHDCEIEQAFDRLQMKVRADVQTRESQRSGLVDRFFEVKMSGDARFEVLSLNTACKIIGGVRFDRGESDISVSDLSGDMVSWRFDAHPVVYVGQPRFIVSVSGDDSGRCRELWEVSQMALESLLFWDRSA